MEDFNEYPSIKSLQRELSVCDDQIDMWYKKRKAIRKAIERKESEG